jgi:hypothetical protein
MGFERDTATIKHLVGMSPSRKAGGLKLCFSFENGISALICRYPNVCSIIAQIGICQVGIFKNGGNSGHLVFTA